MREHDLQPSPVPVPVPAGLPLSERFVPVCLPDRFGVARLCASISLAIEPVLPVRVSYRLRPRADAHHHPSIIHNPSCLATAHQAFDPAYVCMYM